MQHTHRTLRPHPPGPQRGAALLMAMIIVTVVSTIAVSMVWQQWRAVQIEIAERARSQSAWILSGALDWARIILREDSRTGGADHMGEPWAVPLAEVRLSTFLATDKDNSEDAPEAFLSGGITDEQSRYNLRNLTDNGQILPQELAILQRLSELVGVSPELALTVATGLRDADTPPAGSETAVINNNPPLQPQRLEQIVWLGVPPEAVARLAPHVTLLPGRTHVNANTASREVLAAVVPGLDLGSAERLVQMRQRTPFKSLDEVKAQLPAPSQSVAPAQLGTTTNFFEVRGRLRLSDRVLEQRSLVERRAMDIIPLSRDWISSHDAG